MLLFCKRFFPSPPLSGGVQNRRIDGKITNVNKNNDDAERAPKTVDRDETPSLSGKRCVGFVTFI